MAMSDCALTVHLVIYSSGIYTVVSFKISGHHITLDLYNENDSLKDK